MKTILIVDDDRVMQRILGFVLEKEDYTTIAADNGLMALQSLEANQVDLVIADLKMPQMDGLALVREIRKRERFARIPVIMLTMDAKTAAREEAEATGVSDFLTKPVSSDRLLAAVESLLAPRNGVPAAT